MAVKNLKTSCMFPLFAVDIKIEKTEVREVSGIQYILLSLIKNEESIEGSAAMKLSDALKNFGVPKDLLPMFTNEMVYLIEEGILQTLGGRRYTWWIEEDAKVSDFAFTQLGDKLFREKAIPTGKKAQVQKRVYFDPICGTFTFGGELSIVRSGMQNSAIKDIVLPKSDFVFDALPAWAEENKVHLGIKPQEQIVGVHSEISELVPHKVEDSLSLDISEGELTLSFDPKYEAFAKKYFTGSLVSSIVASKTKFEFPKNIQVREIMGKKKHMLDSNVYLPSSIQTVVGTNCDLIVGVGTYDVTKMRAKTTVASKALTNMDAEWIAFANSGEGKTYIAANVKFEGTMVGEVQIPLIIEETLTPDQKAEVLRKLYLEVSQGEVDTQSIVLIKVIADLAKDDSLIERYVSVAVLEQKEIERRIQNFKVASQVLGKNGLIQALAEKLIREIKQKVTLDNIGFYKQQISPIYAAVGARDSRFLSDMIDSIQTASAQKMFVALMTAGFGEDEVLPYANVVAEYAEKALRGKEIKNDNELANNFIVLANKLKELKMLLGVQSTTNYRVRAEYVVADVMESFRVLKDKYERVVRHENYAQESFAEIKKYVDIFQDVADFILLEAAASEAPEEITKQQLEQELNRGRLNDCIITAAVILDRALQAKGLAGDLVDKINEAEAKKLISAEERSTSHELRLARNNYAHGLGKDITYTPADIRQWLTLVFAIKERK